MIDCDLGDRLLWLVAAVVAGPIEPAVVDFGGFVEAKVDCSRDQRSTYSLLRYVYLIANRYAGRHHPLSG